MTVGIKYPSLVLLLFAGVACAADIGNGRRIEAAREVLDSRSHYGRDRLLADWERHHGDPGSLGTASPPEALALAALWIDQAAVSPAVQRQRALAFADALLTQLRATRPAAPGASVLRVRADLIRFGQPQASTIAAFARSYQQARFLRNEGLWRLAFAAVYWSRLPAATRTAAVNEALWLARLDGRLRIAVDQLIAGTPLALPVALRLIG